MSESGSTKTAMEHTRGDDTVKRIKDTASGKIFIGDRV